MKTLLAPLALVVSVTGIPSLAFAAPGHFACLSALSKAGQLNDRTSTFDRRRPIAQQLAPLDPVGLRAVTADAVLSVEPGEAAAKIVYITPSGACAATPPAAQAFHLASDSGWTYTLDTSSVRPLHGPALPSVDFDVWGNSGAKEETGEWVNSFGFNSPTYGSTAAQHTLKCVDARGPDTDKILEKAVLEQVLPVAAKHEERSPVLETCRKASPEIAKQIRKARDADLPAGTRAPVTGAGSAR